MTADRVLVCAFLALALVFALMGARFVGLSLVMSAAGIILGYVLPRAPR